MRRRYDTAIDRRRGIRRRDIAAVLGIVVLALNLLSGIALSLRPAERSLAERAFANGWNVICSGAGLIVIDAEGHQVPDDQTGAPRSHSPQCLFCLPLMHGDMAAPPFSCIVVPTRIVVTGLSITTPLTRDHIAPTTTVWARGPPSLVDV